MKYVVFVVVSFVLSSVAAGQPARVMSLQLQSDWYGNGLHEYFSNDYEAAISSLSAAISANPDDPRPYFFRGLAFLQMCNRAAAANDFRQAALYEVAGSGRASGAVNRALERIQGAARIEIEKHRRTARFAFHVRRNVPDAAKPVIYGDMIDVNSIAPIIENVIPVDQSPQPIPVESPESPTHSTPLPDVPDDSGL